MPISNALNFPYLDDQDDDQQQQQAAAPAPQVAASAPMQTIAPSASQIPTIREYQPNPQRQQQERGLRQSLMSMENPTPPTGFFGKAGKILQTIGSVAGNAILGEGTASLIPGTFQHAAAQHSATQNELQGLEGQDQQDEKSFGENQMRGVQTQKAQQDLDDEPAIAKSTVDKNEAEATKANRPDLAQAYATAVTAAMKNGGDPSTDPVVQHLADAITQIQKQAIPKEANPAQATYDSLIKQGMSPAQAYEKIREKPASVSVNPGTWSLQTGTDGNPILFNSKTGQTQAAPGNIARKPNAEEQKRADLAQNVNENLNTLEEIVTRRPDLFGMVSGRMTGLKQMVGTSDPDVAKLETVKDNLGMAMQSAHGMRSAQHVETSAQSVLNGFKNSPEALKAAIKTARNSVGTFQSDVQNPNQAGKPQGGQEPPRPANVPAAYKFNASGPKGAGWYR